MSSSARPLAIAMVAVGVVFTFGIFPLTRLWTSGWSWTPDQPEYLQMILGLYATLGIFLMLGARDPLAHRSLVSFAGWSSIVHGGIMAVQAMRDPSEHGHLMGDIPALLAVGVVLLVLLGMAGRGQPAQSIGAGS